MSRKKKTVSRGNSMVNGISTKGHSVNHKVKIVNLPGSTNEKIPEKLDNIVKEQSRNLIVHPGTNDIVTNVNLSTKVKKNLQ